MTNAEYIQSVSVERLAQFLDSAAMCPPGRYVVGCDRRVRCGDCWAEWLMTEREDAQCAPLHSAPGARRVVEDADPYKGDAE